MKMKEGRREGSRSRATLPARAKEARGALDTFPQFLSGKYSDVQIN